jgi:dephospho-CoA kinase
MLSGKICSGKDFVADILVKKFNFKRYAFADILKREVSEELNLDMWYFTSQEGKAKVSVYGKTYRQLLIDHAEYKKLFDKNYYSKLLLKSIDTNQDRIVISDFRYPYEYEYLKDNLWEYHVKTVNVQRNSSVNSNIESETALNEFEYNLLIDNNGDSEHIVKQFVDYV